MFDFGVMLKVISCRLTSQKMVGFFRVGFFYLNFKEKHFTSSQEGHKGSDIPLQCHT